MRDFASSVVVDLLHTVGPMLNARSLQMVVIPLAFAGCVEAANDDVITAPDRIAGCTETTLAPDARLTGVWIAPSGAVWAVGDGGLVGRRTPSADDAWQWCQAATNVDLSSIWGAADDDLWITGAAGTVLRWRGDSFDPIAVGTTADLSAVWGSGATNVFVVGDGGIARHYDGATWATADVTADELGAVWGANAKDVWIGGQRRTTTTTPGGGQLNGCTASLHRWNTTTRTFTLEQSFPQEHGACGILGIGGSSASDVWAVGTEFPAGAAASFAFAAHLDGGAWSRATPPDEDLTIERTYTDVVARAPGAEDGAWVAATGISAVRRAGSTWSPADQTTADLLDIDARDAQMFAVGEDAKILRWTGAEWLREQ
ncbi:MAG TPA: hypothetical protein VM261_32495 [Kofleriaceae bacterium]|nr:hypothetical protein [Kofleriaceae bacterium]